MQGRLEVAETSAGIRRATVYFSMPHWDGRTVSGGLGVEQLGFAGRIGK